MTWKRVYFSFKVLGVQVSFTRYKLLSVGVGCSLNIRKVDYMCDIFEPWEATASLTFYGHYCLSIIFRG